MPGMYAYTVEIWPPLLGAFFLALLGVYSWQRRDVPGAVPFVATSLFAGLWLLGIALETAAIAPATKITWYKFQLTMQLPAVTAGTCFTLEYVYPGRWLTRRNLGLLALPPLLFLILVITNDLTLIWRFPGIRTDGAVIPDYATPGMILIGYGYGLVFVNAAAFSWLFIRSPQHRWPVALMLFGQVAGRGAYLLDVTSTPPLTVVDLTVVAILLPWTAYAIALFGFRIFDPVPAARETALEQMREGMVVLDLGWRVVSLNSAATEILSTSKVRAHGKPLAEVLPAFREAVARFTDTEPFSAEFSLGTDANIHYYASDSTPLHDFRGLLLGHLLMIREVTDQYRAQGQIVEQQRALAVLQERERLARELHDGLGQTLAATHLQVTTAKVLFAKGETVQGIECLNNVTATTLQAEADVREYLLGAKAAFSTEVLFFPALRQYVARFSQQYDLPVQLSIPPQLEAQGLGTTVEVQLWRIIQEALSNVRKHAHATSVRLLFTQQDSGVCVDIIDDGQGFESTDRRPDSFGLQAMRDRAEAIGGRCEITSQPGQGTRVYVRVPVPIRQNTECKEEIR